MLLRMKNKIILTVIFLLISITFSIIGFNTYTNSIVVDTNESVNLSELTALNIVYADNNTLENNHLSISVGFNDSLLIHLEETMQNAIEKSNEEYRLEQKKIQEEIRRAEELKKYYDSVKDSIIAEKDNAIFTYNPYIKSNLSIEQYNIILKGTGLEGCGESYYIMEQTYNVNGLFALSVACQESGFGRYLSNKNNFYGMRNSKGWMSFESPDANIQYFGELMNKSLYYGKDIYGIAATYCPGTDEYWASCVMSLMKRNFNLL